MHFIQLLALTAGVATATTFQAFGSGDCTSGGGSVVTVHGAGTCSKVTGRNSYICHGDSCRMFLFNSDTLCDVDPFDNVLVGDGECLRNRQAKSICVVGHANRPTACVRNS